MVDTYENCDCSLWYHVRSNWVYEVGPIDSVFQFNRQKLFGRQLLQYQLHTERALGDWTSCYGPFNENLAFLKQDGLGD
jgi:hypothetical protein